MTTRRFILRQDEKLTLERVSLSHFSCISDAPLTSVHALTT